MDDQSQRNQQFMGIVLETQEATQAEDKDMLKENNFV